MRLPGRIRAVQLSALHRGVAGAAESDPQGRLWVEVEERPDEIPPPVKTRELESEYRATVEEILELRGDDGRVSAFVRSIAEPGALADTSGYAPDLTYEQKVELLQTVDVVERLSWRSSSSAAGWPSSRSESASARTSSPARRSSSASICCGARWTRSARSSARTTRPSPRSTAPRSTRPGCPTTCASRPSASSAGSSGWATQSGESSMIRTYLDWLIAVPWSKRSEERLDPGARARGARRRPRRPRRREGAHHRVPGRAQAARGAGRPRRPALGRHPDADRPAGHRQDLDRRVDRACDRAGVRPHVARRRPRRGRDPRPPAHLHRRAAGAAGPCPARRRNDEPGDHARRGRQGRRRLARRPVVGPARGARPGPEPLVPRPLPGRRA